MRTLNVSRSVSRAWPMLLAGTAAVASSTPATAADWTRHFRVGMQITLNIEAEFTSAGSFALPTREGVYDDGFVLPDITGADETTFWAYSNDGQFDPESRLMTFSRIEAFSGDLVETTQDDSPYVGLELAYGTAITRWGDALIGWEAGYGFLPISISDRRRISGVATVGRFQHRVPDDVALVPPAPYRGTRSGVSQPVIELNPTDFFFEDVDAIARGSRTLDASLHTLRLGPTVHLELARRWAFQGGLGPVVGYITGEYSFDERFRIAGTGTTSAQRAEGEFGDDDFVYGGYAQALLIFHFEEHGDIYAGLQFMSLTGTEFEEGDRRAKLDMGATLSFLLGVNWPF